MRTFFASLQRLGLHQQQFAEAEDRRERVVEIVRDAIRHAAERVHALALDDLPLRRLELAERGGELAVALQRRLLGPAPLGDFLLELGIGLDERGRALAHADFELVVDPLELESARACARWRTASSG